MSEPNTANTQYTDTLKLTKVNGGENIAIKKQKVLFGRDASCDVRSESVSVARIHAFFVFENDEWFVCDNMSSSGTMLNDEKLEPGKNYKLCADDKITFADSEYIFYKTGAFKPSADEKMIAALEQAMATFNNSQYKDTEAFKIICSCILECSMYLPAEIDTDAMFAGKDMSKLKKGDIVKPGKDVRVKLVSFNFEDGKQIIPLFTTPEQAHKVAAELSVIRLAPENFLPMIFESGNPAVINYFDENRFVIAPNLIKDVIMPALKQKNEAKTAAFNSNRIGTVVGEKYKIDKQIGKGAYSEVYLGTDTESGKQCMINMLATPKNEAQQTSIEAVVRKTEIMNNFTHPAILKVFDIFKSDDCRFIVTECAKGKPLPVIIKESGALSAEAAVLLAKQIAEAMQYLHTFEPAYTCGEIKNGSIIISSENNKVKLTDLSEAKPSEDAADTKADIYALGIIMYYIVTGIEITESEIKPVPICQINPKLSKGLEYIIDKCVKQNPDERYDDFNEILYDLDNYTSLPKSGGIFKKLFGKGN